MEHVVALNNKQENAAQSLVDRISAATSKALTVDEWLRDLVLAPIRQRAREIDEEKVASITAALPDATNAQLNQIKAILGVPL